MGSAILSISIKFFYGSTFPKPPGKSIFRYTVFYCCIPGCPAALPGYFISLRRAIFQWFDRWYYWRHCCGIYQWFKFKCKRAGSRTGGTGTGGDYEYWRIRPFPLRCTDRRNFTDDHGFCPPWWHSQLLSFQCY